MKITVGFSRAKDWWLIGSQTIQLAEKRPFSHCYIKYECPVTSMELIVQASHGCVNIMSYDRFQILNLVVEEYEYQVDDKKSNLFFSYINEMVGVPYSRFQLILIAIKKLFHFEVNIHNRDEAFICSELAAVICDMLDIIPDIQEDQDYITPSDLNKMIKDHVNK